MKPTDANRPMRVFEKLLHGGLGAGNVGVVISRHGTGKLAVITTIAVDKAMDGHNVLHLALGESVSDIRAYRDEILAEIAESLDLHHRAEILTSVERHTQIYSYRHGAFSLDRIEQTLRFLAEHAEFKPELIEIQGWPDFRTLSAKDMEGLRSLAQEAACEIWCTAHTAREDHRDARGLPDYLARLEPQLSVIVSLEPAGEHMNLRLLKVHDGPGPESAHLEFDPATMLIRWR